MSKNPIRQIICTSDGVTIDRLSSHNHYHPRPLTVQRLAIAVHRTGMPVRPLLAPAVGWVAEPDFMRTLSLTAALKGKETG